jgi:hypothetical protein
MYKTQNVQFFIFYLLKAKPIEPVAPQFPSWAEGLFLLKVRVSENFALQPI